MVTASHEDPLGIQIPFILAHCLFPLLLCCPLPLLRVSAARVVVAERVPVVDIARRARARRAAFWMIHRAMLDALGADNATDWGAPARSPGGTARARLGGARTAKRN